MSLKGSRATMSRCALTSNNAFPVAQSGCFGTAMQMYLSASWAAKRLRHAVEGCESRGLCSRSQECARGLWVSCAVEGIRSMR